MTATTATTVMTPMMTPRSVRNERSLCAVTAFQATRRSSPISMSGLSSSGFLFGVGTRRRVVDLDAVSDLERAERLERPRDDLLAVREPLEDLGLQVGADPGLDRPKIDGAVLFHDEDAFHVLFLFGRGSGGRRGRCRFLALRALERRRVGDDEGWDGNRERGGAPVGLDLPGDREAGPDVRGRILDLDLHDEVDGRRVRAERGLRDRTAADLRDDAVA